MFMHSKKNSEEGSVNTAEGNEQAVDRNDQEPHTAAQADVADDMGDRIIINEGMTM